MAKRNSKIERIHPNLAQEINQLAKKNDIPKVQASKEIAEYIEKARIKKIKLRRDIVF